MASADVRTDGNDVSAVTDSMNRLGLQNDGGEDQRLGPDGEAAPRTDEEYAQAQLTLRAIVSSKEAGVIIGKAGKNVADLRDETGVKAGVSKVVQGVHDRVLTVTGGLEGISKAYAIVAKGLLEGAPQMGMGGVISSTGTHRKLPIFLLHISRPLVLFLIDANVPWFDSRKATHFPQSNGDDYRSPRPQDQAHSGCLWCQNGGAEGNVTTVD